LNRTKKD